MKVLMLNGSPHEKGCVFTALSEVASELEKYGASSRLAPSSMAITDMPEKKLVRYRNILRPRMGAFFFSIHSPP